MGEKKEYLDRTEIKITLALPAYLVMRLRNKKETQMPIKDFTTKALNNEFARFDSLNWMKEMIPQLMEDAIMRSELGDILAGMANDIKPAFEAIQLQGIEIKTRIAMETLEKKFNLLYLVASGQDPPNDLVSLELLREMIDDGFLIQQSGDIQIRTSD